MILGHLTRRLDPFPLLSGSLPFIPVQQSRKGVSSHLSPALGLLNHDSCRRQTEPDSPPEWGAWGNNRLMQRHNLKPGLPGAGEAAEPPALLGPRPGLDTMGDPLSQPDCNFRRCLCVGFINQDTRDALGLGSRRRAAAEIYWAMARTGLWEDDRKTSENTDVDHDIS